MLGLSLGKKREHAVVVAFAGSASAGAAVCIVGDGPAKVVAAEHVRVPFEAVEEQQILSGVAAGCKEACDKVSAAYAASPEARQYGRVKASYGIIHTPWIQARAFRQEVSFDKESVVKEPMITEAARQAAASFGAPALIESSVIRVELNGYPTPHPAGKRASRLAVTVLLSAGEPAIVRAIGEALQGTFGLQPQLRSDALMLLSIASPSIERHRDMLVVHMSGSATLVLVLRKGVPSGQAVVNEGVRSIIRRISTGGAGGDHALSLVRMISRDACTDEGCATVEDALARAEPELTKSFGETLAELAKERKLPTDLVLIAHPDLGPWLARFFARIDFSQFTLTSRPFSVEVMTLEELHAEEVWRSSSSEDIALATATAFVNREESKRD